MKKTVSPVQASVCIAVVLALVLGIGYYLTFRRGSESSLPMPPAQSRADMVRNMRVHGKSTMMQQPRSRTAPQ